jgi:hypothetical protein
VTRTVTDRAKARVRSTSRSPQRRESTRAPSTWTE